MSCGALSILWSNWGQRFQLVVFLLFGLVFTILHHLLGTYLSGKPGYHLVSYGRWAIPSQSLVNALSNALSQIVKWLLASTVGVAFAQYFWRATKGYDNWHELDAPLAAANGNPFTFSAFPTWWRSPGLAFSALMMMSMIFVPIFVPGSIRVVTAGGLTRPCTVNFPNISMAYLATTTDRPPPIRRGDDSKESLAYLATTIQGREVAKRALLPQDSDQWTGWDAYMATTHTTALVNRVIVGGSYLPVPNPCQGGVCTYQANFTAPALQCSSDINATYDFSTHLPRTYRSSVWLPILNGTLDSDYALTVATRDGVAPDRMNPPVAVRCNASRADYHVRVRHDNSSSHIDILNITSGPPLSPHQPDALTLALGGLVLAIRDAFNGSVIFDSHYDGFAERPLSVGYSPLLRWVHTTNSSSVLTWADLTIALPELMRNISLSLLSEQFPSKNQTYMEKAQTECSMTQLVYDYDSRRLLAIYAVAWATAAIFFSLGFWFVSKNGEEHKLDFSHVVDQRHLGLYSKVLPKDDQ